MEEKTIENKVWDHLTEIANHITGFTRNHPQKEQLHLANRLRHSASVISLGLGMLKAYQSQPKQELSRCIEMMEVTLLEAVNSLKLALLREYIKRYDYDRAYVLIERLHYKLLSQKRTLSSG